MASATVHRLRLGQAIARDQIDGEPREWPVGEFFIDERPLCQWLGIERNLWHYRTDFDERMPEPMRMQARARFLGQLQTGNQFGSDRLVLYACHCGSDYCGVISCRLEVGDDQVIWQDVTFEDDDGPVPAHNVADSQIPTLTPVARLIFDRAQYEQELERHSAR